MGSPRKNYSRNFQQVKDQFQNAAGSLFEKQHHCKLCHNAISYLKRAQISVHHAGHCTRQKGDETLAMIMRNCWILFDRVYVSVSGRYKQSRDLLLRLYISLEKDLQ